MKKNLSPSQSKEIDEVTAQMAETLTHVKEQEAQGNKDTYWHDKLERLGRRLSEIQENDLED